MAALSLIASSQIGRTSFVVLLLLLLLLLLVIIQCQLGVLNFIQEHAKMRRYEFLFSHLSIGSR